jgi:HK97 family phage prohead protease
MSETYKPNKGMKIEAERGLAWKEEGKKGGTRIGLIRARQIARGENLSEDTVKRMYSFFSRHEVNKKAEGFEPDEEGYPSPSRVAWALWGGDPGFVWSKNIVEKLKKENEQRGMKMEIIKRELLLSKGYGEYENEEYEQEEINDIWSFVVSTPEVDRYGTIIMPSGIDYSAFMNNPVVLAQHESEKWPVGRCLGFAMNGENLEATLQVECITEDGRTLNKLINAGFVRAVSVGIIPLETEEQNIDGSKVTVYTKSELVEFSIVSVPANRTALIKRSINQDISNIISKYKKEKRMLTPEIEAKIQDELLPAIQEAIATEVTNLGFTPEEATASALAFIAGGAEAMLMALKGESVDTEDQVDEPPVAEPPVEVVSESSAPSVEANYDPVEKRVGKKISASTQAQIKEGMTKIKEGYKMIDNAVAIDMQRSIQLNIPTRKTIDELLEII